MKLGTRKLKRSSKDIKTLDRIRLMMAGCFDFRVRANSFDMHQLQTQRHKLAKISRLFRSRSEPSVKTSSPVPSPKGSPKHASGKDSPGVSPGAAPRRRFMRVVRDSEQTGEEYENPHVIRKYTQEYVSVLQKSLSVDDRALPYSVSGNTILKKYNSIEEKEGGLCSSGHNSPPLNEKHTSFKEEVEIIEYDKKGKIPCCTLITHTEKLHDDSDDDFFLESDSGEDSELSKDDANSALTTDSSISALTTDSSNSALTTDSSNTALTTDSVKSNIDSEENVKSHQCANDTCDNESSDSNEQEQPIKKSKMHKTTTHHLHHCSQSLVIEGEGNLGTVHIELSSEVILEEDTEALDDLHLLQMRVEP